MRSVLRDILTIVLIGIVATLEVIAIILRGLSKGAGWMTFGVLGAFFGLGMIASVFMEIIAYWVYSQGGVNSDRFWMVTHLMIGNLVVGFLFFGLSLGGIPAMLEATKKALIRRLRASRPV